MQSAIDDPAHANTHGQERVEKMGLMPIFPGTICDDETTSHGPLPPLTTRRAFLGQLSIAPAAFSLFKRLPPENMSTLYVGTYTDGGSKGIYQCRMDPGTGALEIVQATGGIDNPSYLALHPSKRYLYAVSETTEFLGEDSGGVFAYAIDAHSRDLAPLNAQPSRGGAPCYVSVTPDGGAVLVANYLGGNVALLPVRADGGLAAASDVEQHDGSSVDEQRQEAPHAHFIAPDPSGRRALVADLGIDRVIVYDLNDEGLKRARAAALAPGAGPRHVAFHPTEKRVYVINELNSTVTTFRYEDGRMDRLQVVSTLPDDFEGENYCADIHVSADGRFLYGSNRGHDSIVVFETDADGRLTCIQHVSTHGSWPRNFAIDPSGTLLLVANQRSDNVVVFGIDGTSGTLEPTGRTLKVPSPVCLRFLDG